uniref:(northern house mosquito) hypothetical protein n=1 Tax=Culex pipiens TaxID=7175 RepID=A0A8D8FFF0_CULPI
MWAKCAKIAIEKSQNRPASEIFFPRRPRRHEQQQPLQQKEREEGDVVFVLVAVVSGKRRRRRQRCGGETSPQQQLAVKTTASEAAAGADGHRRLGAKQKKIRSSCRLGRRWSSEIAVASSHIHRKCQQTQRASTAEALNALVGPRLMEV